jgi:chromosome segregation ATPase
MPTDAIECPLCLGEGKLKRTEVLDRLGVRDFARVAQLSAEEAFRLLQEKHGSDTQQVWARFENELAKRTADAELRHQSDLQALSVRNDTLSRRAEDSLRELVELRKEKQALETELSRVARVGRREEMDFVDEARTWAGICVSEKLPKNGDFLLSYRDASGAPLEPRMLVDNKDKSVISEADIDKLVRDARERSIAVAVLVARTEDQLRQVDRDCRFARKDGIWILRSTRQSLPRDLNVLRPLLEQMRIHGSDFLERNAALADEVRRTFADIDRIESELKKAARAITSASGLVAKYRERLQELCESAVRRENARGK